MTEWLRFHPAVASDIAEAIGWYEERSAGLGERFRSALNARLDEIAATPELFPRAFGDADFRFVRLRRFPYLVFYRIRRESVFVLSVFHFATDPDKWRRRAADRR